MEYFLLVFLMFLRFGGLFVIFPLFIMARIPVKLRVALALMIGVVMAGNITVTPDWRAMGMGDMARIVFFELTTGILLGLVCRMVFYALEIAGLRISTDSGLFITMNFSGMEGIPQQAPSIVLFPPPPPHSIGSYFYQSRQSIMFPVSGLPPPQSPKLSCSSHPL